MAATLTLTGQEPFSTGVFNIKLDGVDYLSYLTEAKDVHPHVEQLLPSPSPAPAFKGSPDEFLAFHQGKEALQRQMKNKVRKCPQCSKAVAFTLPNCNSCGEALSSVPITFTNNVFTGFLYGIEKGPFPFTVSMRYQDARVMVFDDLLALCPAHLNVIPTTAYIPDWRFLIKDPAAGKEVLKELYDRTWETIKIQFLQNEAWRNKMIKGGDKINIESLKAHLAVGFNYPPSQYQLHLQFMLPPFTPFHYYSYLKGLHFTPGRFFPIEYAQKVLDLGIKYDVKDDTPIEDIVAFFKGKGVDYDAIHAECYARYGASHVLLSNFDPADFAAIAVDGKRIFRFDGGKSLQLVEAPTADIKAAQADDKTALQNYGRPYAEGKKPRGSYYLYPKKFPDDVISW